MKRTWLVGGLLIGSGACALIYQVVWLREFRLVFGASTASSAAVLALFMGGLGFGSLFLGRRADSHPTPLAFYGRLELAVAATAALSPFLVTVVRAVYLWTGGVGSLGLVLATTLRIALSAVVIGFPAFCMGGTFPAAVRAVEDASDPGRRRLAFLYGCNTLGAVTGAGLCTFFFLERFGIRDTLWVAALVNVLVGMAALKQAKARADHAGDARLEAVETKAAPEEPAAPAGRDFARVGVGLAAGATGFVFFLMEIVWYRMLGPILGGSVYTFGLILMVALLGIGVGGILNGFFARRGKQPTWTMFAATCLLEGAFLAVPLYLGDFLAVYTALLAPLGAAGFGLKCLTWFMVTAVVVLPAAVAAGIQFPLLIALIGRGGERVGRETGVVYAANTLGAILGSLAGGFGLLPLLGAVSLWRFSVLVLVATGVASAALTFRHWGISWRKAIFPACTALLALVLAFGTTGPSTPWRHRGIGAGRAELVGKEWNQVLAWMNDSRHMLLWERDGVESSIGILAENGLAFVVNGKVDGNAIGDATTQVMLGLLPAALHPEVRQVGVVGLGTGCTAGWLAALPSVRRVEVMELEPAVMEMARRCGPVNLNVMNNPKVHVTLNDARESLQTTSQRYDILVSEPSNPYRAGVAGLFTQEFYLTVKSVLNPGGIFAQWVQAYEVDAETVRTILATLSSVFPHVEVWQTNPSDMVVICSEKPPTPSAEALRVRLGGEPYRSALRKVWRVEDLEGFLARFVAGAELTRIIAKQEGNHLNTDELMRVEYGFARTVGRPGLFRIAEIRQVAKLQGCARPEWLSGAVDWPGVERHQILMTVLPDGQGPVGGQAPPHPYIQALQNGNYAQIVQFWRASGVSPAANIERAFVAEALAQAGDPLALTFAAQLREDEPLEALAIESRFLWVKGQREQAVARMQLALQTYRRDPWPCPTLMARFLEMVKVVGESDPNILAALEPGLREPFAMRAHDRFRERVLLEFAFMRGPAVAAAALARVEPHVPWNHAVLQFRAELYARMNHPLADRAMAELLQFLGNAPSCFQDWFLTEKGGGGQPQPDARR